MLNVPKSTLKIVSATFLLVCFLSLKKSTSGTRKKDVCFSSKAFSFSIKPKFRILHIQISWRDQMSKHKTRNIFYWIIWEVSTVCYWDLAILCHITIGKNFIKKFFKNYDLKTSSRLFCVCKELSTTSVKLLVLDV